MELGRHLYNRGTSGTAIFRSDADREHFRNLLSRYLSATGKGEVDLLAFCLLTTHFHLIVRELVDGGTARFMQRLIAAYAIYYRQTYGGRGPLFDGPYRRKTITDIKQLRWTIGYVNANHSSGVDWRYSSHRFYVNGSAPSWLDARGGLVAFGGASGYAEFMNKRAARNQFDDEFFG
ncbi:MAG: hypothetical protein JHC98_05550 [Thermoleophilaceae bacterium]|nr:hypothetical protein [Thermoleophilaceae bacterium]